MLLGLPYWARFHFVKHALNWHFICWYNIFEAGRAGITIMNIKMKKLRLREACGYRLGFVKEPWYLLQILPLTL